MPKATVIKNVNCSGSPTAGMPFERYKSRCFDPGSCPATETPRAAREETNDTKQKVDRFAPHGCASASQLPSLYNDSVYAADYRLVLKSGRAVHFPLHRRLRCSIDPSDRTTEDDSVVSNGKGRNKIEAPSKTKLASQHYVGRSPVFPAVSTPTVGPRNSTSAFCDEVTDAIKCSAALNRFIPRHPRPAAE